MAGEDSHLATCERPVSLGYIWPLRKDREKEKREKRRNICIYYLYWQGSTELLVEVRSVARVKWGSFLIIRNKNWYFVNYQLNLTGGSLFVIIINAKRPNFIGSHCKYRCFPRFRTHLGYRSPYFRIGNLHAVVKTRRYKNVPFLASALTINIWSY